jgi:methionyl-tRNA synthetase
MKNLYITTPIYYVNDKPHIGHCYTNIVTDTEARISLLSGKTVRMQTGTDEHGQKVYRNSESQGKNVQVFCDEISAVFKDLAIKTNICAGYHKFDENNFISRGYENNFDNGKNFIRTTEGRDKNGNITDESLKNGRHIKAVQKFWTKLDKNGWLYKAKYSGWYSTRDEAFYGEDEIKDGKSIATDADVEWMEEECYFFKLSKMKNALLYFYKKNPNFINSGKLSEVISFVNGNSSGEMTDLCVSRTTLSWGVPVPGDEKHVMYVWLDALVNYVSALGYDNSNDYNKFWSNGEKIHVMGKDIMRFHAVYWPAFLIAEKVHIYNIENNITDNDEVAKNLPNKLIVHGWWLNNGQKISKSLKNTIDPLEEINILTKANEKMPISEEIANDYFRYFLLKSFKIGSDGNYSREDLKQLVNCDLVNGIGNLVQRVTSFIFKNFEGKIYKNQFMKSSQIYKIETHTPDKISEILSSISTIESLANTFISPPSISPENKDILAKRFETYVKNDKYCENHPIMTSPWALFKEGKIEDSQLILSYAMTNIFKLGVLLQPIVPFISEKILAIFNLKIGILLSEIDEEGAIFHIFKSNQNIILTQIQHICPRIETLE